MSLYLKRVGLATDQWINAVVWAGNANETVSQHAAKDAAQGKRLGCAVCRVLSVLVERDHCAKTLDPSQPTATLASLRAAAVMVAFFAIIYLGLKELWK